MPELAASYGNTIFLWLTFLSGHTTRHFVVLEKNHDFMEYFGFQNVTLFGCKELCNFDGNNFPIY